MATQQILFAETIAGMKKAFKRKAWESDSDSEIESYTNRGHKLKRRARFTNKGQLIPADGPSGYKEALDYAGVRRSIVYRNPPLIDDEGYEVDSEEDEERVGAAALAAAELNPYANIHLEHVLAPLTASTELSTHPTLSKPFTSKTLTSLVDHSCKIMHRENHSLWEVRHLWTALCGDATWLPGELMLGANDVELYSEDQIAQHLAALTKVAAINGVAKEPPGSGNGESKNRANGEAGNNDADTSMADTEADEAKAVKKEGDRSNKDKTNADTESKGQGLGKEAQAPQVEGHGENQHEQPGSESDGPTFVHPMFLPPGSARPDRDLGLPETEAEDIRRLLAMYIQKQEEICRGASRLHEGLLRAERLRAEVLHWSKAEAHCGPNRDLSDGEDWYDKEEWGLTDDLKKGQDEEEEDTTTQGKKTRARRQ